MALCRNSLIIRRALSLAPRLMSTGEFGSGAGKGGGSGGTIRDAGGSFGKMEAAHEEQYFRQKQAEQLAALRDHIHDEIKELKDDIARHQKRLQELQEIEKK